MFFINCLGKKTADRQFSSIKRKKQNVQKTKGTGSGIFVEVFISCRQRAVSEAILILRQIEVRTGFQFPR